MGESLALELEKRMLELTTYLSDRRTTQSLFEECTMSQTSLSRRQILLSLAVLIPKVFF